jgi:hypothetical protein
VLIAPPVVVSPGDDPVGSHPAVIAAERARDEARVAFDAFDELWLAAVADTGPSTCSDETPTSGTSTVTPSGYGRDRERMRTGSPKPKGSPGAARPSLGCGGQGQLQDRGRAIHGTAGCRRSRPNGRNGSKGGSEMAVTAQRVTVSTMPIALNAAGLTWRQEAVDGRQCECDEQWLARISSVTAGAGYELAPGAVVRLAVPSGEPCAQPDHGADVVVHVFHLGRDRRVTKIRPGPAVNGGRWPLLVVRTFVLTTNVLWAKIDVMGSPEYDSASPDLGGAGAQI